MKLTILPTVLLVVGGLCTGCSHAYTVTFDESKARGDRISVNTFNRRLADKGVVIVRRDSSEYPASGIFLTRDSCLFTGDTGHNSIATADILSVWYIDRFSGAIGGFGIGIMTGLVAGVGVGLLAEAASGNREMLVVGIIPVLLAPVLGFVIGGAKGTRIEYQLPQPSPDSAVVRPVPLR